MSRCMDDDDALGSSRAAAAAGESASRRMGISDLDLQLWGGEGDIYWFAPLSLSVSLFKFMGLDYTGICLISSE